MTHVTQPGKPVHLRQIDPDDVSGWTREDAEARADELGAELGELQELLYAAGKHALLIILQGRDTSGKDGTIRFLLRHMNAQGTLIVPFKVPTPKELAHDFLWRVHQGTPGKGETVIFNRSHYEDVLVVRVHSLVPESVWSKRYAHIEAFERLLIDSNTIVVKFMLHISKSEQEQRLLDREKETEKAWKLNVNDWKEREHWDAYTEAYEAALERGSGSCPWHIVPADKKWFRNLAVAHTLVETLRPYRDEWMAHLTTMGERAKADLQAYRASRMP